MATTHPRTLLPGSAPRSEERVFAALRDALPDPWEVFHSVDVIALAADDPGRSDGRGSAGGPARSGRGGATTGEAARSTSAGAAPDGRANPNAGRRDGEVDFVLVHPDEAVVCLEVKGGPLQTSGGAWFRPRGDGGRPDQIVDPFRQAADHKHELARAFDEHRKAAERRLAEEPDLPAPARRQAERLATLPRKQELLLVHALALPDLSVHGLVLGADAPPELVVDQAGMRDLAASLERVLHHWRGTQDRRRPPGLDGAEALRELLAPTQTLETPLAAAFVDEARQLVELTASQTRALRGLANDPHVVVTGCAGSGKTMLAVAHARRLADAGREVLLCCFNRSLAEHLEATCAHPRVTYATFHGLCVALAHEAGLDVPTYPDGNAPAEHWSDVLPGLLLEALDRLGTQWDAVLVDEAQDFRQHWLETVRCGLHAGEDGPTWLFLDGRQRLYDVGDLEIPAGFRPYELTENCRTTRAIHRELVALRGPVGVGEQAASSGTSAGDVTVPAAADRHGADHRGAAGGGGGARTIRDAPDHEARRDAAGPPATADTLVGELGPESVGPEGRPIELITARDQPRAVREGTADAQRYVALSRARHHVIEVRAA